MVRKKRQKSSILMRRLLLFWILIAAPFLGSSEGSGPRQRFANEPSPQTAVIGSTVVLPCRIINKKGELQWTRDGFGLGNERELFSFSRYGMIGADEEGDFSLRISPVTLEDDAEFQCQVTGWQDADGVRSQTAKLTVYVPPKRPEIPQGSVVRSTAGAAVKLECISRGGKPAAEIQWLDSTGRVILDGVKFSKTKLEDGHRYDSKSTLTFIADRNHHNAILTCSATNPALHQPNKTQVRLEVTFPPEILITHDEEGYKEGEDAVLTCSAYANPNIVSFSWYRGGKLVSKGNQTRLVVNHVTREARLEDIKCEASNEVATSNKITRIDVHYGPSFRVNPKDVFAEEGENVTLRCQVDGSPRPKIVWIPQKNSSYIYGTGSTLTLTADQNNIGTYLCLAKVEGFTEISTTVGLFLKGPPTVMAESVQWGVLSSVGRVTCFVPSSTPNSVHVNWLRGESAVDILSDRFLVEKESKDHGVVVRLLIKETALDDFGDYNCSVQNGFGTDVARVSFMRKRTIPLMLVVSCVVGGFLFIVVLSVCLVVYGKRKAAKQKSAKNSLPEKAVAMQVSDQNSVGLDSDVKVELGGRTAPSVTTNDVIFEPTWESKRESVDTPTYMSNMSPYLYPENFNGLKMNGHAPGALSNSGFGDYLSHSDSTMNSGALSQQPNIPSLYNNMGTSTFSCRGQSGPFQSAPHNLYSVYHKCSESGPSESLEGLRGLSSAYSNGYAGHSFKSNTSTLPLSLHVNRNGSAASPGASGPPPTTTLISNGHRPPSGTCTIPRLGIPSDPSHYIVSPRTQLVQGSLATHV